MIGIPVARRRISSSVFKESLEFLQSQHVSPSASNGNMATEIVDQFQVAQLLGLSEQNESSRFPIPRLSQLNNSQWSLALGPQLVKCTHLMRLADLVLGKAIGQRVQSTNRDPSL